eukprot:TRINITY_DN871_c0_g1_i1.p1 TRINITY_DN871_c0_g1~~TRINITY_DN871_c0_g1_i1.p1  ORF type:complete len:503 (+),score=40.48 TRINITY_DN871_c0_g1_i1:41-1510(+)
MATTFSVLPTPNGSGDGNKISSRMEELEEGADAEDDEENENGEAGADPNVDDGTAILDGELQEWQRAHPLQFSRLVQRLVDDDGLYSTLKQAKQNQTGTTLQPEIDLTGDEEENSVSLSYSGVRHLFWIVKSKRHLTLMRTPSKQPNVLTVQYITDIKSIVIPLYTTMLTMGAFLSIDQVAWRQVLFWISIFGPLFVVDALARLQHEARCREVLFYMFFDEGIVVDLANMNVGRILSYRFTWLWFITVACQMVFLTQSNAPYEALSVVALQSLDYLALFYTSMSSETGLISLSKVVESFPSQPGKRAEKNKYGVINKKAWKRCCQALHPFALVSERRLKRVCVSLYVQSIAKSKTIPLHELFAAACTAKANYNIEVEDSLSLSCWKKLYTKIVVKPRYATFILKKLRNSDKASETALILKKQYASQFSRRLRILHYVSLFSILVVIVYLCVRVRFPSCESHAERLALCEQQAEHTDNFFDAIASYFPWN